jgi:hypothetical protein
MIYLCRFITDDYVRPSTYISDTGTTVIDMMKRRQKQPGMHRKDHGQRFSDIYSTVIDI